MLTEKPPVQQLERFRSYLGAFVRFTDDEWAIFTSCLWLKKLKKRSFLVEAGKVCREVGFIIKGSVRHFHIKDGEEVTAYFSLDNELVSSYKSFLTRQPSVTSIETLESTELIVFSYDDLQSLFADGRINYKIERFGRVLAESLICCYEDRVFSFVTETPEERYVKLLKSNSDILFRIPQHYIANYLGITAVSLSRIRRRLVSPVLSGKN